MANITKRLHKDGTAAYTIRVYKGKGVDGKQLKPYITTWKPPQGLKPKQVEKELQRFCALFEEQCKQGRVTTERRTFGAYAEYVIDLKERNGMKRSTVNRYHELLERINECDGIGWVKLVDLRPDMLNTFYERLGKEGANRKTGGALSPKTITEYHRFISSVLSQALKEDLLQSNVAQRATPPKIPKHEVVPFEAEEVTRIMEALEHEPMKWRVLTYIFIFTGARRGEVLGLRWNDVDQTSNKLFLRNNLLYDHTKGGLYETTLKTGENRVVSVSPNVISLLRQWRVEQAQTLFRCNNAFDGYIFTQSDGRPLHPDSVTDYFAKLSARYGLPHINPHKFRHTQASILISEGVDIVSVSKRLGHAKVSTTMDIYAHILARSDEKAAGVLSEVFSSTT